MFQLNSWIPLLSASSRLAVRIRTWHPSKCLVPACNQHRHSRTASVLVTRRFQHVESATFAQPLEPMLLPKLRIYFADFPWSHCSIDQRLFTSESGCGYRYGPSIRDEEISGRAFVRIVKAPRTARGMRRFLYVFIRLSPSEMIFEAQATSKRKDNSPQARLPWTYRRQLL